jgi:predicted aldo/keto reductase-like oxidoreductase
MQYVDFGKTGIKVSEIGFGAIPIQRVSFDEAERIIRTAIGLGFTLFDTANAYGDSEEKIGRAITGVRDQLVLCTKSTAKDPSTMQRHLEQSLKSLRTDYIDVYHIHNIRDRESYDRLMAPDSVFDFMKTAQAKGQIRFLAASVHSLEMAKLTLEAGFFAVVQMPLNFISYEFCDEALPLAKTHNLAVLGMKPLGGSAIEDAPLAFRYLQQFPSAFPIPGCQRVEEVEQIARLYERKTPLTQADLETIDRIRSELGRTFCRACGYCEPCSVGIKIQLVMKFEAIKARFPHEKMVDFLEESMVKVEQCDNCGECLARCPYDLPIPETIRTLSQKYFLYKAEQTEKA